MTSKYGARMTGLLTAIAALWVLSTTRAVTSEMWIGALSLAIAGEIVRQVPKVRLIGPVLALPGAILIAHQGGLPGAGLEGDWPAWIPTFVIATIAIGAPLIGEVDRAYRTRDLALPLLGIAALGAFFCVPDTEEIGLVAPIYLLVGILGWLNRGVVLGSSGGWAAVGVLVWAIAMGGRGREGSIIGATACLGLLLAEPIGRRLAGRDRQAPLSSGSLERRFYLILQVALVFFMARVAGFRDTPRDAAELAIPAMLAAIGAVVALERFLPRRADVSKKYSRYSGDPDDVTSSRYASYSDTHTDARSRGSSRSHSDSSHDSDRSSDSGSDVESEEKSELEERQLE